MLCSMKMAVRRTGTYRYSGSACVATVRAPQMTMPEAGKTRMTFTPIGLRVSCSASVISLVNPTAPPMFASVPAGAFQTPRLASIRAYIPATYPDGGSRIGSGETPVGSIALSHGK